ncbi:MAG: hypothetical protein NZ765_04535 [Anaerolineae bacterium]|nr:hypothetical protein [Anaerolineae bacterium]MDW8070556.1 hypothetical protein [Anaerolineae bacterium]
MSQTWENEESYGASYYPYPEGGYEYPVEPPEKPARPTGLLTAVLVIGVVACSCLSCLIGTGIGLVVWEELNARSQASVPQDVSTNQTRTRTAWQTADVVNAFWDAGLECEDPQPLAVDDGTAPFTADEATRFMLPSVCDGCSGRIYSFSDQEQLNRARDYYIELGEQDPQYFSWIYVRENILVQLNGRMPEERAQLYRQALMRMR